MGEDVEAKLARLEARLEALQAEVGGAPAPVATRPPAPPAPPEDPLDRFGVELRRLAGELVAAYDRVVAHERRATGESRRIELEAQADLHALAGLERALRQAPGVRAVELRAYAAGHASLVVDLEDPRPRRSP